MLKVSAVIILFNLPVFYKKLRKWFYSIEFYSTCKVTCIYLFTTFLFTVGEGKICYSTKESQNIITTIALTRKLWVLFILLLLETPMIPTVKIWGI